MLNLNEMYSVNTEQTQNLIIAFVKSYDALTESEILSLVNDAIKEYQKHKLMVELWELTLSGETLVKRENDGTFSFMLNE